MKAYLEPSLVGKPIVARCKALGIGYLDRGKVCPHATTFCRSSCYYNKFIARFREVRTYIKRCATMWELIPSIAFARFDRVRLCKVGDPFAKIEDIGLVYRWALDNPTTLFWAPTRAWRKPDLRSALRDRPDNLRILASIDPSNTPEEIESLVRDGFSTMFFGDDTTAPMPGSFRCPKTWEHKEKHCAVCSAGCFSASRVDVWLKTH